MGPGRDDLDDCIWFIDGSMFDGYEVFATRTGFGIAVVDTDGSLIAAGRGIPHPWITDAAGAELWAFYMVTHLTAFFPQVVTDCYGILQGLRDGPAACVCPKRKLARTWRMIAEKLDGDFRSAVERTTWIPAHTPAEAIGRATDSSGVPITALMWRANRLVDHLAKAAAGQHRLPGWLLATIGHAKELLVHSSAKLGMATHLANKCTVTHRLPDGIVKQEVLRDSTAHRPRPRHSTAPTKRKRMQEETTSRSITLNARLTTAPRDQPAKRRRGSASTSSTTLRRHLVEEQQVAHWLATVELGPSIALPAVQRMENLRARVRAKCTPP